MTAESDRLEEAVSRNRTVDGSAIVLIKGQAQQLRDLANGATEFAALKAAVLAKADDMDASSSDLAAAVSENTPSAPPA